MHLHQSTLLLRSDSAIMELEHGKAVTRIAVMLLLLIFVMEETGNKKIERMQTV